MCGFVGYINKNLDPIDPLMIKKKMQLQEHRGPDDSGITLFSSNEKISVSYSENDLKNLNIQESFCEMTNLETLIYLHELKFIKL